VRILGLMAIVGLACGVGLGASGCPPREEIRPDDRRSDAPLDGGAAKQACAVSARPLSPSGRDGAHPSLAFAPSAGYLAAWEEESAGKRTIMVLPLDEKASPRGAAVEISDVVEGGVEPHVAADGLDGFVVVWTVDRTAGEAAIALRRVDGAGRPRAPVAQVLVARDARALAVARAGGGFAIGWWSWTASPPVEQVTFTDGNGRPIGRSVALSQGPIVEAAIDLVAEGEVVRAAWLEVRDGIDRVVVGQVRPGGVVQRADLGPGTQPSLTAGGAVAARPADGIVAQLAPGGNATTLASGYAPEATARAACFFRNVTAEDKSVDELRCRMASNGEEAVVAALPGGVLGLAAADGASTTGVAYQTEEESEQGAAMRVLFATVRCAGQGSRGMLVAPWKKHLAPRR
jgi:hypothetical protein